MNYNIYPKKEAKTTTATYWKQHRAGHSICIAVFRCASWQMHRHQTRTHTHIRAQFKRWAKEERVFVYILVKKKKILKTRKDKCKHHDWVVFLNVRAVRKGKFEVNRIIYFVHLTSTHSLFPVASTMTAFYLVSFGAQLYCLYLIFIGKCIFLFRAVWSSLFYYFPVFTQTLRLCVIFFCVVVSLFDMRQEISFHGRFLSPSTEKVKRKHCHSCVEKVKGIYWIWKKME